MELEEHRVVTMSRMTVERILKAGIVTIFAINVGCSSDTLSSRNSIVKNSDNIAPKGYDVAPELLGTGSGGGQFDDHASALLSDGVAVLVGFLQKADSKHFESFPAPYNEKENIIKLFRERLLYTEESVMNDGEVRLFEYDLETQTIYYTKRFVEKYGVNKYVTSTQVRLQQIEEMIGLLLHEFSHLLGVGLSKEKDGLSAAFSKGLLYNLMYEKQVCTGVTGENEADKFSLFYNPVIGVGYVYPNLDVTNPLETTDAEGLAAPMDIFQMENEDEARSVLFNLMVEEGQSEDGVRSGSAYDLYEALKDRSAVTDSQKTDRTLFTFGDPNEEGLLEYTYSMEFTDYPEEGVGPLQVSEEGKISMQFTEDDTEDNGLDGKLQFLIHENSVKQESVSFDVDMQCIHMKPSFELGDFLGEEFDEEGFNKKFLNKSMAVYSELLNCEDEDGLQEDALKKQLCDSFKLKMSL